MRAWSARYRRFLADGTVLPLLIAPTKAAPGYRESVKALTCYQGIKQLFALNMITEIGDVKRFAHLR